MRPQLRRQPQPCQQSHESEALPDALREGQQGRWDGEHCRRARPGASVMPRGLDKLDPSQPTRSERRRTPALTPHDGASAGSDA